MHWIHSELILDLNKAAAETAEHAEAHPLPQPPRGAAREAGACRKETRMRTLVQRLKRLWNTPVEFYGVDRPEPQAGPWQGLILFVVILVVLGLLWLIRYLPERMSLVHLISMS
jgi:hypothetical protein